MFCLIRLKKLHDKISIGSWDFPIGNAKLSIVFASLVLRFRYFSSSVSAIFSPYFISNCSQDDWKSTTKNGNTKSQLVLEIFSSEMRKFQSFLLRRSSVFVISVINFCNFFISFRIKLQPEKLPIKCKKTARSNLDIFLRYFDRKCENFNRFCFAGPPFSLLFVINFCNFFISFSIKLQPEKLPIDQKKKRQPKISIGCCHNWIENNRFLLTFPSNRPISFPIHLKKKGRRHFPRHWLMRRERM